MTALPNEDRIRGIIIPFPRPSLRTFESDGVEYCTRQDATKWLERRGYEVASGDGQALVVDGVEIEAVFVNGHGIVYEAEQIRSVQ